MYGSSDCVLTRLYHGAVRLYNAMYAHNICACRVERERERMYDVIMSVYVSVCACVVSVCVSVCVYISALLVCDGA